MANRIGTFRPEYSKPVATQKQKELAGFYSSTRWKRLREWYKIKQPVCEECLAIPVDVHHQEKVRDNWDRRFDPTNLQSLCRSCHHKADNAK